MESTIQSAARRNRRSADQWRELLDRFNRSGQTQEQFCTAHDLGRSTFSRWRKRLRQQRVKPPKHSSDALFVELAQDAPVSPLSPPWDVELQLSAGMVLRLRRAGC